MKSGSRISRLRSETCYTVIRLSDIIGKVLSYHPNPRIELIEKAYVFSAQVHKGQLRLSGEPYLIHPLEVAALLADLKLDDVSVTTGILHDTVEDTFTTPETIEEAFGPEVASLVDGVTKISKMSFRATEEKQAENFRKMLLAMSKDIRVILIKLADRLHNMRTLQFLPPEKTVELAQETMDIYAPLANRLGIFWMKSELEDLSLLLSAPRGVSRPGGEERQHGKGNRGPTSARCAASSAAGLRSSRPGRRSTGRSKHLYSIYRKMQMQNLDFEEIYDLIGFRIIVDSVRDCYEVLGIIHSALETDPRPFQGLHRHAQGQHVPVAAHHGHRSGGQTDRGADPHPGDAPHRGTGHRRPLEIQGGRQAGQRRTTSSLPG